MSRLENVRSRKKNSGKSWFKSYSRITKNSPWKLSSEDDLTIRDVQVTESEGHPFQNHFGKSDVGGPFLTVKTETTGYVGPVVTLYNPDGLHKIVGTLRNPQSPTRSSEAQQYYDFEIDNSWLSEPPDLNEKGATAIALCAPTNPLVQLNTTLAETFKEGLPKLLGVPTWRDRAKRFHGLGTGEFLNAEFAWKPLISEIGETAKLVHDFAKLCEQYKRDEGRLVRRQFHFDVERSEETAKGTSNAYPRIGPGSANTSAGGSASTGNVGIQFITERKTWFSGAFRYHIPDSIIGNIIGAATGASEFTQNLLGDSLTPELLWELTPWSWAIDYFSNAQQVITNLQNIELYGLFMAYGYLMDETIKKTIYTWQTATFGSPNITAPEYTHTTVSKRRVKANPYGFGVSFSDLSPEQLAILAAAGISRLL
jgi:hypothetical protein